MVVKKADKKQDGASSFWGFTFGSTNHNANAKDDSNNMLLRTSKQAAVRCQSAMKETASCCKNNLRSLTTLKLLEMPPTSQTLEETAVSCRRTLASFSARLSSNGRKYQERCQQNFAQLGDILQQSLPWDEIQQVRGSLLEKNAYGDEVVSVRDALVKTQRAHDESNRDVQELLTMGKQQIRGKSSLRDPNRRVTIVTTAALPWMTGTSVNPLLRAAFLSSDDSGRKVTLLVPWLAKTDQEKVFPRDATFDTPEEQEAYIRDWAERRTGCTGFFRVSFYPGRYARDKGSILPVGDLTEYVPDHEADIAILEEPEHLTWYHHGRRWTDKFNHVVGVMHTNYLDYARREDNGQVKETILRRVNQIITRAHCHHVVKLSDAVQTLPRERTMFVHGVSPTFLEVGKQRALSASKDPTRTDFTKGLYFIGKVVWGKGYTELVDLLSKHGERMGQNIHVDIFGNGADLPAVKEEAQRRHLDVKFFGARDHADSSIQDYKVFVNPSMSDVVATTTAEAIAMGKFVVCADHPSNHFFSKFRNCLIYKTDREFTECIEKALSSEPEPLSAEEQRMLTWEAATERLMDVTELTDRQRPKGLEAVIDTVCWAVHNSLMAVESLRVIAGAGSGTKNNPQRIIDYAPPEFDMGGILDRKTEKQSN